MNEEDGPVSERHAKALARRRLKQALAAIYDPPPAVLLPDRDALCDYVRATLGDAPLTYLEFGVKGGRSFKRIAERFTHADARFIGFDSFEGLPEDWLFQPQGRFSTGGKPPDLRDPRMRFVTGWFQNALPGFLNENDIGGAAPLLVHYDADLYGSTLFVLAELWRHADDYYFLFDEFFQEEAVALYDFSRAFPVEIEFLAQTTTTPFKQVFGRMRRVEFKPRRAIEEKPCDASS
ncbi:MAG: hypothetical protein JOZ72_16725 [Alphaproteobacteria bacterium]|nr:hypothetical protein [Alphaproteobacteria bacterium]